MGVTETILQSVTLALFPFCIAKLTQFCRNTKENPLNNVNGFHFPAGLGLTPI